MPPPPPKLTLQVIVIDCALDDCRRQTGGYGSGECKVSTAAAATATGAEFPGTALSVLNARCRIGVVVDVHCNVRRLGVGGRAAVVARVVWLGLGDGQPRYGLRRLLRVHLDAPW